MTSQFLIDGDLFVEVVDNDDGGGFPQKRVDELSQANREGRFDDIAFPFERANGYNGVRQLYSRRGPQENIFRSSWSSSLNFEFIYDRSGRSMIPRWLGGKLGTPPTPSQLTRLDDNSVRLTTAIPEPRRIEVSTTFTLVPPHYIDLETTCVAHPDAFTGDWLGLFWASYIHNPEDKTTYFLGRPDENGPEQWIESLMEQPLNARAFASEADALVEGEPNPDGGLFHNIRPIRYVYPFFYGCWRNMMLELMFKSTESLRFAIQPTGGGRTNPAWDFAMLIKNCQPLTHYTFSARVVFKPFVSREDAWEEYRDWVDD